MSQSEKAKRYAQSMLDAGYVRIHGWYRAEDAPGVKAKRVTKLGPGEHLFKAKTKPA